MLSLKELKVLLFFACFCFFLHAEDITWEGVTYDTDTVSELITVITSTSPIPSMPSTRHIYEAQKSLFLVPALAKCKKIIVFDGEKNTKSHSYNKYKQNIIELTKNDPYFSNTELIFCKKWGHLSGALDTAIKHVDTPFVFIHQHDLIILQTIDLNAVIASMVANPKIKYVGLCQRPLAIDDHYFGPVDENIEGICFAHLCRSTGWSDQSHVTSKEYYTEFVLPQCHNCFMEGVLNHLIKKKGRELFGTHLYGHLGEGPFLYHSDGRNN